MQNSLRWSLSRLLLPCLVALALLSAQSAKADTIFPVSGSADNITQGSLGSCASGATCPFSGTLTVNVTTGTVDAIDVTFPGRTAFDTVTSSNASSSTSWEIVSGNSSNDGLDLFFTTTPTAGSLVNFAGGTIGGNAVATSAGPFLYSSLTGTIGTPVAPVPEPSSLVLAVGLLAFVGIVGLRKRRPVVTTRST